MRFLRVSLFSLLVLAAPLLTGAAPAEKVDFNFDIRPIISSKCFHCHGPDEKSRKAKLRLDLRDEAVKAHDDIFPIVPGDPTTSEIVTRITSTDEDEVMPPPKEGHGLTAPEVELIKKWIAQGAEYKPHWAFVPQTLAPIPVLKNAQARIANPIDAFICARLETAGLTQSPEADRQTLIRRLAFDLTGLPPLPEDVTAFVNDASPTAYDALVDRLLAAPAYGERWAKMWLDLARYADSTGYGSDKLRLNIWPFRDWVINAFNRNLPYDQFTTEQLAGDLLPQPTPEQLVASAFNRNTMTNLEGGTVDEEWRVAAVKDRIATTGQVWLGLTVGCAQCHTHKFDPISHQEYYSFFAIFNQTEDSDREDEAPTMPLPSAAQLAEQQRLRNEITGLESMRQSSSPALAAEQQTWETQLQRTIAWQPLPTLSAKGESDVALDPQPDGSILARGFDPELEIYTIKTKAVPGMTALRLEALTNDALPTHGPGRSETGNAVVSELRVSVAAEHPQPVRGRFVRVELPGKKRILALAEVQVFRGSDNLALQGQARQSSTELGAEPQRAIDGSTDGDFFKRSVSHTEKQDDPWWELDLGAEQAIDAIQLWNRVDGSTESRLAGCKVSILDAARKSLWEKTVADAPNPNTRLAVPGARTVVFQQPSADFSPEGGDVSGLLDGDDKSGWSFAPAVGQPHTAVLEVAQPDDIQPGDELTITLRQTSGQRQTLSHFRLSATTDAAPVRELPPAIQATLALTAAARSPEQSAALTAYFRPLSQHFAGLNEQIAARKSDLAKIKPVAVPVMRELSGDKRRETFIMNKGNYLSHGAKVEPGVIGLFPAAVPQEPMNRLAAAHWILSPENPLTARVAVNRFWSQLFGTGFVETEEDFGSQGALPSHPELLDWLAIAFRSPRSDDPAHFGLGWDVKALLKLIVTSATYRQSSKVTPEVLQIDARNRLLSHFTRRRLEAEAVRDQALALSGLLSRKLGGPSVYPPQPDGLWKVAFNDGQNGYPTSRGEDAHRRGLYTIWRRSMPYPSMATFDAPSRESCTLRRIPTNTPLQAFVTMNDPVFVECSRLLARRLVQEGGPDVASRLRFGLTLALARPADPAAVAALQKLYDETLADFRAHPDDAARLATPPTGADAAELAAWTVIANVLLNLDAVLMKS